MVHVTDKKEKVDIVFRNIKCPIPLLSIRKFAHRVCRATFWKGGGEIVFNSGVVMPLVERMGVYFCQLDIQSPDDLGFVGPGP